MTSAEIRKRFLDFFAEKGHKIIPSSSLIPTDPSVLFTTAGMQQFKPYYTGEQDAKKDFGSHSTVSVQKCARTVDIDEVGDDTHLTFFEMLGNFSFGGYWKHKAIQYAHEFITKELGLTIDYVSIFKDDASGIPADEESRTIWQKIDSNLTVKEHSAADNFWGPTGEEGPCGPTTEIYINGVEIWNIVFNEYYKTKEGKYEPLAIKGIDTGMGLERLLVQVQNKNNVYETDLFEEIFNVLSQFVTSTENKKAIYIVADHIRTATFMLADNVAPSNIGRGYVLRRLLRRAVRFSDVLGMKAGSLGEIAKTVIEKYQNIYSDFKSAHSNTLIIPIEINSEEERFRKTLSKGIKEFEKGTDPFVLATTYGFPIELTEELAKEKGIAVDRVDFERKMAEHQKLSQTASAGMFKGGLAGNSEQIKKLHTAHHLLLAALQQLFGKEVKQRGSNITDERLRIDFSFDRKLTDEEKAELERIVNEKIKENLPVVCRQMPKAEAESIGAEMEFGTKYPDTVSVYFIGPSAIAQDDAFSIEFCGGPHASRTGELGTFKILKEEASSQGVRRIKAVLE